MFLPCPAASPACGGGPFFGRDTFITLRGEKSNPMKSTNFPGKISSDPTKNTPPKRRFLITRGRPFSGPPNSRKKEARTLHTPPMLPGLFPPRPALCPPRKVRRPRGAHCRAQNFGPLLCESFCVPFALCFAKVPVAQSAFVLCFAKVPAAQSAFALCFAEVPAAQLVFALCFAEVPAALSAFALCSGEVPAAQSAFALCFVEVCVPKGESNLQGRWLETAAPSRVKLREIRDPG